MRFVFFVVAHLSLLRVKTVGSEKVLVNLVLTVFYKLISDVFVQEVEVFDVETNSQTIEYMLQKHIGWAPISSSKSGFDVFQNSEDTTLVYRLDIKYFDLLYKDITISL